MTRDKNTEYPYVKSVNKHVSQEMLGINSDKLLIDHFDKESVDDYWWYHKAYHWDRKSRYWRCQAEPVISN
jgi:hypothetical protein